MPIHGTTVGFDPCSPGGHACMPMARADAIERLVVLDEQAHAQHNMNACMPMARPQRKAQAKSSLFVTRSITLKRGQRQCRAISET
jgi:hypothetical protein